MGIGVRPMVERNRVAQGRSLGWSRTPERYLSDTSMQSRKPEAGVKAIDDNRITERGEVFFPRSSPRRQHSRKSNFLSFRRLLQPYRFTEQWSMSMMGRKEGESILVSKKEAPCHSRAGAC